MIAPMSRVELICLNSVRRELVESLQEKGLLHIEDAPVELDEAPDYLQRVQLADEEHERLVQLEELERSLNETVPLLSTPSDSEAVRRAAKESEDWSNDKIADAVREWAGELREVTSRRASLQDTVEVLTNYQTILEQVAPAIGGMDVKLGKGTRALVLTGNVRKVVSRLEERLQSEIGPECTFHKNQTSRKRLVGLLSFPEDKGDHVSRILGQEGVTTVDMRSDEYQDATVGEVITRITHTVGKHRAEIGELESRRDELSAQFGAKLRAAKSIVADRLAQLRVQGQFSQSKMVTVIEGWTPSDQYSELEATIRQEFPNQVEVNRIGHEDIPHTHIPTQLRNHKLFQPFEVLLKIFRPPTYGTLDPTAMIAISFIIFYGFILGDAVYGVAVILFAKWLDKKWGHIDAVHAASTIGVYMGISSIVFGIIYGEYLGNFGELVLGLPVFFHRAHETNTLLLLAVLFGVIHVPLAMILGIREDFRHGHKTHAYEKLGMLLGLTALMIFTCNYFQVPVFAASASLYVAAAAFVVGAVLIFRAMGVMGLVGVLEIMSLGGNVLSYARLMALGIASIALADIANMLPELMPIYVAIPGALLVHLVNVGIGMASPTIHSLRLNFVEFLPKFYSPEGKGYQPFKKETLA